ncbi:MAG TPA: acyl-CoA synthetase [Thermoleophilaceae bacterium]
MNGQDAWRQHLPPGLDPSDLDLLARRSLPRAWSEHWSCDPDRPVLHGEASGWLSAGELDRRTRLVAGRFHRAGMSAGDRIVVSAAASIELVVAHVAALRLGLVVVPMNTAYRRREVAHVVADSEPAAIVTDDPERAAWATEASERPLLALGPEVDLPDADAPELDAADADRDALIGYTSGTTGAPKGAVLSHGNLLASAEAVRLAWRWTEDDRLLLCLPLFHVHGLCVGLHGTLLAGASAVLQQGFETDAVLDGLTAHDATMFFGVPTMYHRLADSPRVGELERLRLCVAGSAPLAAELFERLASSGGQRVLERYGMTETLMNVSNPYDGERRPGSIGLPLPGCEVRLAGGEEGEILLRGPNVFSRYWRNDEATAAAFDEDGWFRSGDLGARDPDGYLRILGRSKELIISGGYNVYPREVEEVLAEHPQVREVAVVGVPSDEWGESVAAFVVPAESSLDEDALLSYAAEQLASYKRPRAIHAVTELPRNALGKVMKHELSP